MTTPPTPSPASVRRAARQSGGAGPLGWIAGIMLLFCIVLTSGVFWLIRDRAEASEAIGRWKGKAEIAEAQAAVWADSLGVLKAREDSIRRSYRRQLQTLAAAESLKTTQDDSLLAALADTTAVADSVWRRRFVEYRDAADSAQNSCRMALGGCEKGWALADSARTAADSLAAAIQRQKEFIDKALQQAERSRKVRLIQGITIGAAACAALNKGMR